MMKRMLSLLLCLVMALSTVPVQAIAQETAEEPMELISETEAVELETEPTEEETAPTEETTVPTEPATEPVEETTVPTEVVTEPTEETAEPTVAEEVVAETTGSDVAMGAVASGTCGPNLRWVLDDAGTLTISGAGKMDNWTTSTAPWYSYQSSIVEVIIETGVTSIGSQAFLGCRKLCYIEIPDSVTSIGYKAFYHCVSLLYVSIPIGVITIEEYAFGYCTGLYSVVIADGVTDIGPHAFDGCTALYSLTIPDSVTSIGDAAFYGCTRLKNITLPNTVTTMGQRVFSHCSNLSSISLPNSITCIEDYTFYLCTELSSINIPKTITSIGTSAFYRCSSLSSITIPDSVTRIGSYAFTECYSLNSISIPTGVVKLEEGLFKTCYRLRSVTIPESVTHIGDSVFYECDSLTSITIPDNVISIGHSAFKSCGSLINIVIPNGVDSIDDHAFEDCIRLTGITIPNGVTSIGSEAFLKCSKLESITIPDSVTYIGNRAFKECSSLQSVMLSRNLTTMGQAVFECCYDLEYITIPDSLSEISNNTFLECFSLCSITIPDSITSIGDSAFSDCDGLTSVTIPNSVIYIGQEVFAGCGCLNNVIIPDSITSISRGAFSNCTNLKSISIPYNVKSIGVEAFYGCSNLGSVTMSENVAEIRNYAFNKCTKLSDIYYSGTDEQWTALLATTYRYVNQPLFSDTLTVHYNWIPDTGESTYLDYVPVICYINKENAEKPEEKFILSSQMVAAIGSDTFYSNAEGQIILKGESEALVTFSQEGYVTRSFTLADLLNYNAVRLQKESEAPVISALWMGNRDLLHQEVIMDYASDNSVSVVPEINWGTGGTGSLSLYQEGNSVSLVDGNNTIQLASNFDITKDIFLVATNGNDKTSKKVLKITRSSENSWLEGFTFNWTDSLEFVCPEGMGPLSGKKLKVGMNAPVPVQVARSDDKVWVAIGYQAGVDVKPDEWEVKSFINSVEKMISTVKEKPDQIQKYQDVRNEMKKLGNKLAKVNGSLGADGDFSVMAFAEGTIIDGEFVMTNSGGLIVFSASVGYTQNFFAGPVPMYFEINLSGDLESKINLYINREIKAFTPSMEIEADVAVGGGAGVGIAKVVTFGGGLKGKFIHNLNIEKGSIEYYRLDAALDWYWKVKALFFTFEDGDTIGRKTLREDPKPGSSTKMMPLQNDAGAGGGKIDYYDTSQYNADDLSYLLKDFDSMGDGASTFARRSLGKNTPFVSNAYEGADPQTVSFSDGTRLAVWIGYNSGYSGYNALNLYYSYYDGEWSQPQVVENDGTTDAYPDLKVIDDNAYLVWQDAATSIGSNVTLDSIATLMDITGAVFDKEAERFVCSAVTSYSGVLNMQPKLCGDNSTVYVVWHRNSENDWFGQNTSNSLLQSRFSGGSWGSPTVLYSKLNPLLDFDVTYSSGDCIIAYSMDLDGNLNTPEDVEVYKNGTALTANSHMDSGVTFSGSDLYWYSGGKLLKNGYDTMPEDAFISSDRFQIINENGVNAVVYAEEDGFESILYAAYLDVISGGWGNPVVLYREGTSIPSFSASATVDGEISVLIQSQDVIDEFDGTDPYGTVNLIWYNAPMGCDLRVDNIRYDSGNYSKDNDMPVHITVTNVGELAVQKLQIEVTDEDGTVVQNETVDEKLLSGVTKEIEFVYHVANVEADRKLTISVLPTDLEDISTEDNTGELVLSWEDLAVEGIRAGTTATNKIVIHASIVNKGYHPQSNITVTLRKESPSGDIAETITLESIEASSRKAVSFVLGDSIGKVYYVTIDHKETDQNYANDSDFINISAFIDTDDEVIEYTYGQNVQIKLIEPWGIRANAKISTSAGVVDYDSLYDYGVYFIRKSALDRAGLTQSTITVADILNDTDARKMTKADGVMVSSDYLSAIYDNDIYTYELDDSVFVMFYFITEEGADPIYVPVRERNLKTLAQQRMNDAASFPNDLERDVYKKMVTLEADVTDYRSDFTSLSTPEMQKAPTLAQYPLGAAAANSSYTYGQNAQIKLIEPWGLKANVKVSLNGCVIDYSTVEEYGMVVLADNSKVYNDASEILQNENAYVFSSKNGDASIAGGYISATYSKDIYTYQLDTDIYVFGYVKDADGYHYGPVRNRNVHDLMMARKDDAANFPNVKERTVYTDMIDLYAAITAYREDYFKN